jgi:hypothetical protein
MPDKFHIFSNAVRTRFKEMAQEPLFVVASDRDKIWERYLSAFPPGTDPMFRQRTEHDCSCCRHFIRDIGDVVAIQNGTVSTVWDLNGLPEPYQTVADAMAEHVRSLAVSNIFLTPFPKHGVAENKALLDGTLFNFNHFAVEVPKKFISSECDEKRGTARTTQAVLKRGLSELSQEAVATVIDLIASKALYRGEEHLRSVNEFSALQARYLSTAEDQRELLLWALLDNPVARFRNTVIGTLVQDLSEGVDLEAAVRSFETKVAPQNYKRPTSLITKGMVDAAMKTIGELGLEAALQRRHAKLSDVNVNSVLFVDNSVKAELKGGVRDLLMQEVKPVTLDLKRAEEITVEKFMAEVLPKTTGLQLLPDNSHLGNFVNITAPVQESTGQLLRWNNDFAWSYEGNVTDTIKDRVKRAGGQVDDVALRVSLAWFNTDDLDLHIMEPDRNHIHFANKSNKLDVDMNVSRLVRDPVENVRWKAAPKDGVYKVSVHNFNKRESIDVGFVIEVESSRGLETLRFEKAVPSRHQQLVCEITVKGGVVQSIAAAEGIVKGSSSQERWGLKTLELARVNSVVLSPNYWDDNAVGNKHWFFILDGCNNPLPTRGLYNEFLHPRLEKHRKVFEVLGDKMKCPVAGEQLAGVGFSSTRRDKVTVIAVGPSLNKIYTIAF